MADASYAESTYPPGSTRLPAVYFMLRPLSHEILHYRQEKKHPRLKPFVTQNLPDARRRRSRSSFLPRRETQTYTLEIFQHTFPIPETPARPRPTDDVAAPKKLFNLMECNGKKKCRATDAAAAESALHGALEGARRTGGPPDFATRTA